MFVGYVVYFEHYKSSGVPDHCISIFALRISNSKQIFEANGIIIVRRGGRQTSEVFFTRAKLSKRNEKRELTSAVKNVHPIQRCV